MEMEKATKAKDLLSLREKMNAIKSYMDRDKTYWWGFTTPNINRLESDRTLFMPDILRDKFVKAVDECIEEIESEIEKL